MSSCRRSRCTTLRLALPPLASRVAAVCRRSCSRKSLMPAFVGLEPAPCGRQPRIGYRVALAAHHGATNSLNDPGRFCNVGKNVISRVVLQRPQDFAQFRTERNCCWRSTFADHRNGAVAPIDVGLFQVDDFALAEARLEREPNGREVIVASGQCHHERRLLMRLERLGSLPRLLEQIFFPIDVAHVLSQCFRARSNTQRTSSVTVRLTVAGETPSPRRRAIASDIIAGPMSGSGVFAPMPLLLSSQSSAVKTVLP